MNVMWWKRARDVRDDRSDAATARDERLSAYLDNDLDTGARAQLEADLATDPELREALEGMGEVHAALRGMGDVRAPRSFALPAPLVRAPSRLEWATRAGTVAAAVAFVFVLSVRGSVGQEAGTAFSSVEDSAGAGALLAPERKAAQDAATAGGAEVESAATPMITADTARSEAARSAGTVQGDAGVTAAAPAAAPAVAPSAPSPPPPAGGFGGGAPQGPVTGTQVGTPPATGNVPTNPTEQMPAPTAALLPFDGYAQSATAGGDSNREAWALGLLTGALLAFALWQWLARRRAVARSVR
jgi:hypothetical protein